MKKSDLKALHASAAELLPFTRVRELGSAFNVRISGDGVNDFASRWPGSGLRGLRGVTFQFMKSNGDLADVFYDNGTPERWDGPALSALVDEAKAIGIARLGLKGLSFGYSGNKSVKPCGCNRK